VLHRGRHDGDLGTAMRSTKPQPITPRIGRRPGPPCKTAGANVVSTIAATDPKLLIKRRLRRSTGRISGLVSTVWPSLHRKMNEAFKKTFRTKRQQVELGHAPGQSQRPPTMGDRLCSPTGHVRQHFDEHCRRHETPIPQALRRVLSESAVSRFDGHLVTARRAHQLLARPRQKIIFPAAASSRSDARAAANQPRLHRRPQVRQRNNARMISMVADDAHRRSINICRNARRLCASVVSAAVTGCPSNRESRSLKTCGGVP